MNTTDTYVSWPCRLKIGAKSKKGKIRIIFQKPNTIHLLLFSDPHVRIVGKVEQVQRAKDNILSTLDSRVSCGSLNGLR